MLPKVYLKYEENEEVKEVVKEGLTSMTDILFEQCKKAWLQAKNKRLISVRLVEQKYTKNPEWVKYKNGMLEGGEGYNPHHEFILAGQKEKVWKV